MHDQHEILKSQTKESRELERKLKELEETLDKEEGVNGRLENQVTSYLQKKKFEDTLLWLRRKKSVLVSYLIQN